MTYADEVLADNPTGFWLLDETSGTTANDSSGNANHGTYTGSPALGTDEIAGLVTPLFDGVDDKVDLPAQNLVGSPFTVEAWARCDGFAAQSAVISENIVGEGGIFAIMGLQVGGPGASDQISAGSYSGNQGTPNWTWSTLQGDTWATGAVHHLVYTHDETTGRFYVDGVEVDSATFAPNSSNDGWRIGTRYDGASYWSGTIGGVALYDSALSAGRVAVHYSSAFEAAVAFGGSGTLSVTAEPDPTFAAVAFSGTGLLAVTVEADEPATATVAFQASGTFDVITRPVGKRRRLVVVDIHGEPFGELENGTVGSLTYGLNEPEDFALQLPLSDPKAALLLDERFREIQVWRGDQLLAWGPTVRPSADKNSLAVSCKGALWYLTRRNIGKASRTNYVVNGDFEDGLSGWNVGALSPFEPLATRSDVYWDASTPSDRVLTGTHALYLEQLASGVPRYGVAASQFFVWDVDPDTNPEGDQWSLVARCFIPAGDWRGPPGDEVGIRLARYSTTETVSITPDDGSTPVLYPKPIESVTATLDENTPRDVWTRLEAALLSPVTGQPEFVQVTLYCPDGAILWDRAALSLDEGLRFYGVDQALIAKGLVEHLQDGDYGKSDLNLATDMPLTGVTRDRTYLHHEHAGGMTTLEEFTSLDNGFDLSVAYTPTTRTVRTHHPARGTYRPSYALGLGRNIADFAMAWDGESAANQVIVLGTGDGSDREEASATNVSAYSEGLTLETVFSAPPATPIDSLDDVAIETLTTSTGPEVLSITCTAPTDGQPDPVGVLWPGDTVPVTIPPAGIDAVYRIVQLIITPDDTLELTLNRR